MENLPNTDNSLTKVGYKYEVKLGKGCKVFSAEPFASKFKNLGEVVIMSHAFDDYQPCAQDCMDLLGNLSNLLQQASDRKYVIASKINPIHDDLASKNDDRSGWHEQDVLKMFLADAKVLRDDNLIKWEVCATVSVEHTHGVDLRSAPANQPIFI
jgi:hypothetical protein